MIEQKNLNVIKKLKYLLGSMGTEILFAIERGARTKETIKLLSGVPVECINGRLPVLIDLNLVINTKEGFIITKNGLKLIDHLKSKEKRS